MRIDAALALARVAQRAPSLRDYEQDSLSVVRRLVGGDVAMMVRAEGLGPGALGVDPAVARRTRADWSTYERELAPVFDDARRSGGVSVDAEVLGPSFRKTRVYRDFVRPHGGCATLFGIISLGDELLATVALGRLRRGFADRERRALTALLPTFALAEAAMRRRGELCTALTPRERQIVAHLRLGHTNGQVASALGTSVNTVRNQLSAIFRKLGAASRAEAVALSFGHGPR
jgi:DNA-binding CsgD family transcriptional regulator